jgi:hypothetical protein
MKYTYLTNAYLYRVHRQSECTHFNLPHSFRTLRIVSNGTDMYFHQKSLNWLVKYTLKYIINFLFTYLIYKYFFEMRSSMFNAQLRVLFYFSTNRLADLNMNIPVNTREYFRLTDF